MVDCAFTVSLLHLIVWFEWLFKRTMWSLDQQKQQNESASSQLPRQNAPGAGRLQFDSKFNHYQHFHPPPPENRFMSEYEQPPPSKNRYPNNLDNDSMPLEANRYPNDIEKPKRYIDNEIPPVKNRPLPPIPPPKPVRKPVESITSVKRYSVSSSVVLTAGHPLVIK